MQTEFGKITFSKKIVSQVVKDSALQSYGVVGLTEPLFLKKVSSFLKSPSTRGIDVRFTDEDNVDIRLYVILEYGVNISEVVKNLSERVKYDVKNLLGIHVHSINITVSGVKG